LGLTNQNTSVKEIKLIIFFSTKNYFSKDTYDF